MQPRWLVMGGGMDKIGRVRYLGVLLPWRVEAGDDATDPEEASDAIARMPESRPTLRTLSNPLSLMP